MAASVAVHHEPAGRLARHGRRRGEWWSALRYCAGIFVVVRIALFLVSAAAWGLSNERTLAGIDGFPRHLPNGWHNVVTSWIRLDALWFLKIAQHGYAPGPRAAFYPLYPALIRAASYLTLGHLVPAALLVANAALLAALVVLYRLTEQEFDLPTARRAVLYLCLFPTAFFLFDAYSEAVFLLAAVAAIALARNRHWMWAGLAGLAAALTHSTGVVVVLALVAEAIHQAVEDRRLPGTRSGRLVAVTVGRLAASAVPVAGPLGYLLYWHWRFHDWYEQLRVERSIWYRMFSPPWLTLWHGWTDAWQNASTADRGWFMLDLVLVLAGLALAVWVAIRTRPVYIVFTWASILFFLIDSNPDRPLESAPRFLVTIFPLVWALARVGRRPRVHEAVIAVSAASMGICAWLFLTTMQFY